MTAETSTESLSPLVVKGVAWNGTSRIATRGTQFLVTLVLARLLAPADFGLAAMASIVTMLGSMISEMGFGVAIVQKKQLSDDDVSTAFWTSILLGAAITLLTFVLAPLGAAAFRNDTVGPVIQWSSLGLLVGALAVTPQAMLVRRIEFRPIAMADISSSIAYGVSAIGLAASGFGVWSLVIAGIVLGVVRTVVLVAKSGIRPFRPISTKSLREILPFGLKMFGSNVVQYLRSNLDYLVVGATLGSTSLGLYTLAYKLADFPRLRLATTITEVALPRLSAVQDRDDEVIRTYSTSLTGVTLITFPLLVGLASLAPEFIDVLYGPTWRGAIQPLQILLMMGLLQSVADAAMTTVVAKGHAGKHLRLSISYLVVVGIFTVVGVRWGITGVALGMSAATVLYLVGVQFALNRILSIPSSVTLRSMAIPALASGFMAIVIFTVREAATQYGVAVEWWLPAAVVIGAIAFVAAILIAVGPDRAKRTYNALRSRRRDSETSAADVVGV